MTTILTEPIDIKNTSSSDEMSVQIKSRYSQKAQYDVSFRSEINNTKYMKNTYIKVIDKPKDITGDNISDIGYLIDYIETGYSFTIQLLVEDSLLNDEVPIPKATVNLTITLLDDDGKQYINSTSLKTNITGIIFFNFTGFWTNEGKYIKEINLGASGSVCFEFEGDDQHTKSRTEIEINYVARRPQAFDSDDYGNPLPFLLLLTLFYGCLIALSVVLVIYLRRIEKRKRFLKEIKSCYNIDMNFSKKFDLNKALTNLNKSLQYAKKIGYKQSEASILRLIVLIYLDKKDYYRALNLLKKSYKINREFGCKEDEILDLICATQIFLGKGNLEKAQRYHQKAIEKRSLII